MRKPFQFLILSAVAITVAVACIMFHDNGVPDSISETEKVYVIETWAKADRQMDDIIEKFREFNECPQSESEICRDLTKALHGWHDTMDLMVNEPTFWVRIPEYNELQSHMMHKIESELGQATSDFVDEAGRRKSEGMYDAEAYELLRKALGRKSKFETSELCDPTECICCRCKRFLVGYFASKVILGKVD